MFVIDLNVMFKGQRKTQFVLNQMGVIIVRNMLSTDQSQQSRTMRKVTANAAMTGKTTAKAMLVTSRRSEKSKRKAKAFRHGDIVRKTC